MDKFGYSGDPKFRPLSAWAYFGYTLLFSLPIAGLVLLIVFSFNNSNINRRSFARSYFILLLLAAILMGILAAAGIFAGSNYYNSYNW